MCTLRLTQANIISIELNNCIQKDFDGFSQTHANKMAVRHTLLIFCLKESKSTSEQFWLNTKQKGEVLKKKVQKKKTQTWPYCQWMSAPLSSVNHTMPVERRRVKRIWKTTCLLSIDSWLSTRHLRNKWQISKMQISWQSSANAVKVDKTDWKAIEQQKGIERKRKAH